MSRMHVRLLLSLIATGAVLVLLNFPVAGGMRVGPLLEPFNGLYFTARHADGSGPGTIEIAGLTGPTQVVTDKRGVPHIFGESDRDAVTTLGFVVARDRLFQIDFIARAALGELAEVLGESALDTDRYFVGLGMRWAAEKQTRRLLEEQGLQHDLIRWYQEGVNAYIDSLDPEEYPFEFRLLGYEPRTLEIEHVVSVLLYMAYDLSFTSKDFQYDVLRDSLSPDDYNRLYPAYSKLSAPIVFPEEGSVVANDSAASTAGSEHNASGNSNIAFQVDPARVGGSLTEGLIPGKGSNNWAVDGSRSVTGYPILAGDMHLNLSLPAIWYEAHLVSPDLNVYGVTIPGAPVIIEGITEKTAWAYTNTGSDQIDFFSLNVSESETHYLVDGAYEAFETRFEEIKISGREPVTDTLRLSRYGPVQVRGNTTSSIRWTALDSSSTLLAIWKMGKAKDYDQFQSATRHYDSPVQNILYADRAGTIAIRSTGYNPIRKDRGSGATTFDGAASENEWEGRIPFDHLPAMHRPERGYLTSTNQQPAKEWYPYYLGEDWRDAFRSLRIDYLLSTSEQHSVDDFKSYQSDVYVMQAEYFLPLLESVYDLSPEAAALKAKLLTWDRFATVDQAAPFLFHEFFSRLKELAWDEPLFRNVRAPAESRLYRLMTEEPDSKWLDNVSTPELENANTLLAAALEVVADQYDLDAASADSSLMWRDKHHLEIRHITRSEALRALWRGPLEYPGYSQTLSPARGLNATASASWRVIVDFSTVPPTAFGVYPGGQSGNPFSERYDNFIETYLNFDYYSLSLPTSVAEFEEESILHEFWARPSQ